MTITLYSLQQSRADRIQWLLEELGIDFKTLSLSREGPYFSKLKELHPLGKSPLIEDDGKVIAESGLICEYLIDKYGSDTLKPNTADDALMVKQLSWHSESSLSVVLMLLYISWNVKTKSPFYIRPLARMIADGADSAYAGKEVKLHMSYLNTLLENNTHGFLVGDRLTGADILEYFPVKMAFTLQFADPEPYPAVKAWVEKMEARPAFKKAQQDLKRAKAADRPIDCGPSRL